MSVAVRAGRTVGLLLVTSVTEKTISLNLSTMIKITLLDFICIYERVRSETHPQACTLSHTAWLLLSRADSTSSWLLLLLLFLPLWLWWYLLYPWRWPSSANCHISCSLGTKIDREIIRLLLLLLGHVLFSVLDPLPPVMTDASKRFIYMLIFFSDLTGSCFSNVCPLKGPYRDYYRI